MLRKISFPTLTATSLLASLFAIVVAVYAIYLLTVGETWTVVPESIIRVTNTSLSVNTVHIPYPPGFIPLTAAILLLIGLSSKQSLFSWLGLAILLTFSLLFLFGSGGILLPIAGLLLILLLIISYMQKKVPVS